MGAVQCGLPSRLMGILCGCIPRDVSKGYGDAPASAIALAEVSAFHKDLSAKDLAANASSSDANRVRTFTVERVGETPVSMVYQLLDTSASRRTTCQLKPAEGVWCVEKIHAGESVLCEFDLKTGEICAARIALYAWATSVAAALRMFDIPVPGSAYIPDSTLHPIDGMTVELARMLHGSWPQEAKVRIVASGSFLREPFVFADARRIFEAQWRMFAPTILGSIYSEVEDKLLLEAQDDRGAIYGALEIGGRSLHLQLVSPYGDQRMCSAWHFSRMLLNRFEQVTEPAV